MTVWLPLTSVVYPLDLVRFRTNRVLSLACARFTLFNTPWSAAKLLFCSPLVVLGKSSAMRGGVLMVNPAGGLVSGCVVVIVIATRSPDMPAKSTFSILFGAVSAAAGNPVRPRPESSNRPAIVMLVLVIMFIFPTPNLANQHVQLFPASHPSFHLARFPSASHRTR